MYTPRRNMLFQFMPSFSMRETYDVAIMNHGMTVKRLSGANIKKRILTSHGVIPGAEKPVEGADFYVAVSEEVQDRLAKDGFKSTVIRNPIDLQRFKSSTPPPKKLTDVLFLSNNPRNQMSTNLEEAAKLANINLIIGGRENRIIKTREAMEKVGMVFGLGRSAYEAMSMERNVAIFDYKGADGVATTETLPLYRYSNCSGRYHKEQWDEFEIMEAFESYDPDRGATLREYIRENNNVVDAAQRYLAL